MYWVQPDSQITPSPENGAVNFLLAVDLVILQEINGLGVWSKPVRVSGDGLLPAFLP